MNSYDLLRTQEHHQAQNFFSLFFFLTQNRTNENEDGRKVEAPTRTNSWEFRVRVKQISQLINRVHGAAVFKLLDQPFLLYEKIRKRVKKILRSLLSLRKNHNFLFHCSLVEKIEVYMVFWQSTKNDCASFF